MHLVIHHCLLLPVGLHIRMIFAIITLRRFFISYIWCGTSSDFPATWVFSHALAMEIIFARCWHLSPVLLWQYMWPKIMHFPPPPAPLSIHFSPLISEGCEHSYDIWISCIMVSFLLLPKCQGKTWEIFNLIPNLVWFLLCFLFSYLPVVTYLFRCELCSVIYYLSFDSILIKAVISLFKGKQISIAFLQSIMSLHGIFS